jgi:hypothetical protein
MNTTLRSRSASLVFVLAFLLFIAGCSRSAPSSTSHASPAAAAAGAGGGEVAATALPVSDRSLIVTMNVAITVERVDDASARIRAAVERAGGFVADQRSSGTEGDVTAHLELRIPADKVSGIRSSLGELGEITSSNEKVEDVTEQRADLEARLHSARIQEKRILEIMSGKATSIHELVEAEKELARIRENIERLEAQERVMKSKIQLATVSVSLATKTTGAWQTPGPSLVRAGKLGVQSAAAITVYGGMAFVAVAPTLLPILAVVFGIVTLVRRRRMKAFAVAAG